MTVSYGASNADPVTETERSLPRSAHGPSVFEWLFAIFALVLYQGAFFPILRSLRQGVGAAAFQEGGETGDPIARLALLGTIVMLLLITAVQWRRMYPMLRMTWPFWAFIVLCLASSTWSDNPALAARRSVSLFGSFLFGVYCFTRFGPRRFIFLVALLGGLEAFSSIVLLVAAPTLANDPSYFVTNAVRGVYAQKNQLSAYNLFGLCAAFAVLFFYRTRSAQMKLVTGLSILLMIGTLVLSRGASSMIGFGFVVVLLLFNFDGINWRLRLVFGYFCVAVFILLAFLFWFDPDSLLGLVGKDSSLTGRLPVWAESAKAIMAQPLLGYGYNTFWDPQLTRTRYLWQLVGWQADGSHDGYLDLMLGVGVPGALYYVLLSGRTIFLAFRYARFDLPEFKWFLLFSAAMFILNIDEGTLAWPDAISTQMVVGYCMVQSLLLKRRAM